jgi:hypothetical protein
MDETVNPQSRQMRFQVIHEARDKEKQKQGECVTGLQHVHLAEQWDDDLEGLARNCPGVPTTLGVDDALPLARAQHRTQSLSPSGASRPCRTLTSR